MNDTDNLPATVNGGTDVALAGSAADGGITGAVEHLMAHLSHRAEVFDDISFTLHSDRGADGSSKTCFSYRACKRK